MEGPWTSWDRFGRSASLEEDGVLFKIESDGASTESGRANDAIKISHVFFGSSQDEGPLLHSEDWPYIDRVHLHRKQGVPAGSGDIEILAENAQALKHCAETPVKQRQVLCASI